MTAKELSTKRTNLLVEIGDIVFKLYTDIGSNGKEYIYIRSLDESMDITCGEDRIKQFTTTKKAKEYCINITKKFLEHNLKTLNKYIKENK